MAEFANGGIVEHDPERTPLVDPQYICDYIIPWSVARMLGIEPCLEES